MYKPGSIIFQEGEKGDLFYIIERGSVEVLKNTDKGPRR